MRAPLRSPFSSRRRATPGKPPRACGAGPTSAPARARPPSAARALATLCRPGTRRVTSASIPAPRARKRLPPPGSIRIRPRSTPPPGRARRRRAPGRNGGRAEPSVRADGPLARMTTPEAAEAEGGEGLGELRERAPARVVIELEVRDHRDLRLKLEEARVALVRLRDQPTRPRPRRRWSALRPARRRAARRRGRRPGRRRSRAAPRCTSRRGRLAVRAGDREQATLRGRARRAARRDGSPAGRARGHAPAPGCPPGSPWRPPPPRRRGTWSASWPSCGSMPAARRRSMYEDSARSEPVTSAPSSFADQRQPAHPGAADRDEVQPPPLHLSHDSAALQDLAGDPLGGVRLRQPTRRDPHRRSRSSSPSSSAIAALSRWARELGVGDHHRRPAVGHPAGVGRLVVTRRMGIRDQDRRASRRRDLHHRAARAGDDQVSSGEDVAQVRLVLDQRVALRSALLVPAAAQLRHSRDGPTTCRIQGWPTWSCGAPVRRVKASKAARLIERAPRLPPTTVTQSAGSGIPKRRRATVAIRLDHGARDGPPGDHVRPAVPARDREGEADAPGAAGEQPVGEAQVAVGLGQDQRQAHPHGRQPRRARHVPAATHARRRRAAAPAGGGLRPPRGMPASARAQPSAGSGGRGR